MHFVREKTLLEAIASSLTELFSPVIIGERVEGMLAHIRFRHRETLAYFAKRPPQAKKDSRLRARLCEAQCAHAAPSSVWSRRARIQDAACSGSMLDALHFAYVAPGTFRRAHCAEGIANAR